MERDGLLYPDLMPPAYLPAVPESSQRLAAAGLSTVAVLWAVLGVAISRSAPGGGTEPPWPTVQFGLGLLGLGLLAAFGARSGERLSTLLEDRR